MFQYGNPKNKTSKSIYISVQLTDQTPCENKFLNFCPFFTLFYGVNVNVKIFKSML